MTENVRAKQICVTRKFLYAAPMSPDAAPALGKSARGPASQPLPRADQCPGPEEPGRPAGLRERKKLATRQALGTAAVRLAVERGLENVLVEDIAAAAGVSPRTFNNYFASKYEAICALALDRSFQIGEALRERPASERLWDAVRNAVLDVYGAASEVPDPQIIARIQLVTSSPVLRGEYLKALSIMQYELAEAVTQRTGAVSAADMFFTRAFAGAITAVIQAATEHWLFTDPPVALAPLIEDALGELADGMRAVLPNADTPENGEPPMTA
jgi:AcrR family transcriptional regulator